MNVKGITNRQAICDTLLKAAEADKDIVVLCTDSRGSGSMTAFADTYPEQFIELGIAEQNLVSVSAGIATCGKKVFAVSPASFLSTRSYEQIKVDVAYSETNVTLIGISGGISYGALGMTHHSCQDIAAIAALPGIRVYLPSDRFQTAALFNRLLADDKPAYVRVSRTPSDDIYDENEIFDINKAKSFSFGNDVLIVACGEMVKRSLDAAELLKAQGIGVTVLDMFCVKPLDEDTLLSYANDVKAVFTVEEHSPFGGLGSMVAQSVSAHCPKKVINISLPDGHIIAGTNTEAFDYYGLNAEGICNRVVEELK